MKLIANYSLLSHVKCVPQVAQLGAKQARNPVLAHVRLKLEHRRVHTESIGCIIFSPLCVRR